MTYPDSPSQSRLNRVAVSPPPLAERLEDRRLLSGGPRLLGVTLQGSATACTGIVMKFNEALDPTSAQDIHDYSVGRVTQSSSSSDGIPFLPFLARPKVSPIKNNKVVITSAVYDDATQTVTLVPSAPFKAWKFFRTIRVKGLGSHIVKDVAGNPFDGKGIGAASDLVFTYVYHHGKHVSFRDADGDVVHLDLKGPGEIFLIQQPHKNPSPMVFMSGTTSAKSVLTGTVRKAHKGDGTVVLAELQGTNSVQTNLLTNPAFSVQLVQP
ncbi:MAG: Calx-beta protein [Phycisphaerales bacterium]|jgi:hypothetical protein|nr:Calx-beta protein [Phycisphaerales bacterium]MDB5299910.1 Calx-beta protein [Phycisphaerales bacterium]